MEPETLFAKQSQHGLVVIALLTAFGTAAGCDDDSTDPTGPVEVTAVASNFDDNTADGWTGVFGLVSPTPVFLHDAVFQSGGHSLYTSGDDNWFRAPAKYLSDKSGYYGGTLNYWYLWSHNGGPGAVSGSPDVVITGRNGVAITHDHPGDPTDTVRSWQMFSHSIDDASGWKVLSTGAPATRADIEGVLQDVADLLIRASKRAPPGGTNHYIDEIELKG